MTLFIIQLANVNRVVLSENVVYSNMIRAVKSWRHPSAHASLIKRLSFMIIL